MSFVSISCIFVYSFSIFDWLMTGLGIAMECDLAKYIVGSYAFSYSKFSCRYEIIYIQKAYLHSYSFDYPSVTNTKGIFYTVRGLRGSLLRGKQFFFGGGGRSTDPRGHLDYYQW